MEIKGIYIKAADLAAILATEPVSTDVMTEVYDTDYDFYSRYAERAGRRVVSEMHDDDEDGSDTSESKKIQWGGWRSEATYAGGVKVIYRSEYWCVRGDPTSLRVSSENVSVKNIWEIQRGGQRVQVISDDGQGVTGEDLAYIMWKISPRGFRFLKYADVFPGE